MLWERSLQGLVPWLVLDTLIPEREYAHGLSEVETKLKSLTQDESSLAKAWEKEAEGRIVFGAGRKVKWGESRLLLWLLHGKYEGKQ